MAEIKKIAYSGTDVNTNGTSFFPVTVTKAVYDSSSRTLYDILYGAYVDLLNGNSNGIYEWLKHLETKFNDYETVANVQTLSGNVGSLSDAFNTLQSDYRNFKIGVNSDFTNFVDRTNQILDSKLQYDLEPTIGSAKLVPSGGIYSYVERLFNQIKRTNNSPYKQVVDMAEYSPFDKEIVLYVGETTLQNEKGSFYQYNVTSSGDDPDEVICSGTGEVTVTGTWTKVGSIIDGGEPTDLTNYYTKIEVNNLLDGKSDTDTTYSGDGTTVSIDANNVISAIIPRYVGDGTTVTVVGNVISANIPTIDLTNYYTKTQVNELIGNINPGSSYVAGSNILIDGNTINAVVPEVNNAKLSIYYGLQKLGDFTANADEDVTITIPEPTQGLQPDWEQDDDTKSDFIKNKPSLFDGDYNSLTNVPDPVQPDWAQNDTDAADYINNKPTIPTKTSDLTNDSGFITSHQTIPVIDVQVNGVSVVTNKVANIQIDPAPVGSLPVGVILLWSGSVDTIPSGWVLCDGTNGTPNLSHKFVVGTWMIAEDVYNVDATGGSETVTLTLNQIPSHTHTIDSSGSHRHGFVGDRRLTSVADYTIYDETPIAYDTQSDSDTGGHIYGTTQDGSHTHTIGSAGSGAAHNNMPPYYALAYIMYKGYTEIDSRPVRPETND